MAAAESREITMSEALKEAKDWHVHQLGGGLPGHQGQAEDAGYGMVGSLDRGGNPCPPARKKEN